MRNVGRVMDQVLARLRQPGRVVVTAHARPDGDALGAALALGRLLRTERPVRVALARGELGATAVLEGVEALVEPAAAADEADLLVTVDCASRDRLPEPLQAAAARLPVINIDHHATNTRFGAVNWVDEAASSCGELVWMLARRAGWPLDRAAAEALWVAVVTDSGRFAYENTRPETLRCAADLLQHGVRTAWLNDRLYGQFDVRVMRLRQRAWASLEIWGEGEVAAVTLTRGDFAATGCTKADAEDVVEIPRAVRGNRLALFFYEAGPEGAGTRLSIRTRPPLDAIRLAAEFGGGGHTRAAGCTIPLPLAEARAVVRARAETWVAGG